MVNSDARKKEVALGRIKRLSSSGLQLEPFVRGIFELVHDAVPHHPNKAFLAGGADRIDAYIGSTPETTAAIPLHTRFLVESGPKVSGTRFQMTSTAMQQIMPYRTIWLHDDIWQPEFHWAEGYNEVHRPLGWSQLVLVAYQDRGTFLGFYPIWRGADQKPFSSNDLAFLKASAPHIAHGLKVAQSLRHAVWDSDGFVALSDTSSGVILLDRQGKAVAMDMRARSIFHQLGAFDGAKMSDELNYVRETLKRIFLNRDSGQSTAAAPVLTLYHHWTGIVVTLRGIQMIGSQGGKYITVLLERGGTPRARHARLIIRWGLSQREAEILALIGENKTGPEIAILLGISHDTVRKHTSHIF